MPSAPPSSGEDGGGDRVRLRRPPGLPDRGDVVDVDAQADRSSSGHRRPGASAETTARGRYVRGLLSGSPLQR